MSAATTSPTDPLYAETVRLAGALRKALAPAKSPAIQVAAQNVASLKDQRTAACTAEREAAVALRDAPQPSSAIRRGAAETTRQRVAIEEKTKAARANLAALTEAAAPAVVANLAPQTMAARQVIEALLDQLDAVLDPLAETRQALVRNGISPPRVVAEADHLSAYVRAIRTMVAGR